MSVAGPAVFRALHLDLIVGERAVCRHPAGTSPGIQSVQTSIRYQQGLRQAEDGTGDESQRQKGRDTKQRAPERRLRASFALGAKEQL